MSYGQVDINAMNNDMQGHGGRKYYKVSERGEGVFFCPPWGADVKVPWFRAMVHFKLGQGPTRCLKEANLPCAACAANSELFNLKDNLSAQEISKEIYGKPVFFYNLIPSVINNGGTIMFNSQDPNRKPEVVPYMASKTVQDMIVSLYQSNGNIFNPNDGMVVNLMNLKTGQHTRTLATIPVNMRGRIHESLVPFLSTLSDLSKDEVPFITVEQMQLMVDAKLAGFRSATNRIINPGIPNNHPPMNVSNPYAPPQPPVWNAAPPPPHQVPQMPPQMPQGTVNTMQAPPMTSAGSVPALVPPPAPNVAAPTDADLDDFAQFLKAKQGKK